jgi:hypothetical protein
MGKIKDLLNQKISLSEMWQSFALATPFSFFKKKKEETRDLGPLITYKTADVVKLCVSKDITGFEKLYPNSKGGFEHEMIKKAMVNEIVEHLVKSDLINWYKSNGDDFGFPNTQLKAEIWVAKK